MTYKLNSRSSLNKVIRTFQEHWLQICILSVFVILTSLFFPSGKSLQFAYKTDDIAREPVIAPFTFPILKTEGKLKNDLEEAIRSEPFVFHRDQKIVDVWTKEIHELFQLLSELRMKFNQMIQSKDLVYRYRYETQYQTVLAEFSSDSVAISRLLSQFQKKYPFQIEEDPWKSFLFLSEKESKKDDKNISYLEEQIIQVCRNRWAEGIYDIAKHSILSDKVLVFQEEIPVLFSPDDFTDLEEAWVKTKIEINKLFQIETNPLRIIGYNLVIEFMQPNLVYDRETTERRQTARTDRVPRFQGTVLKDERIVDENTRINEDILQKLQSLATAIEAKEGLQTGLEIISTYIGRIILIGVVISFLITFLIIYRKPVFDDWKMMLLISLIFFVELGITYIIVLRLDSSPYLIPITVAAMTFTILFDARIGFMGTTSMAILIGIMIGNDFDFMVVAIFTSSVAMYNVRELRTRTQVFKTIFSLLAASLVVMIGLWLFKGSGWNGIQVDIINLFIMSILAPIVTYGLIGLLEIGFQITTDLTLLELLDFDHPLLKRLQQEANGTFNHSIVVGNLAEACANSIGARSLLCRVGAYYHDVGKIVMPEYFIENQFTGENKHDSLTPNMSAKTIQNHVKVGVNLGKEYGIPKIIRDFIPMHHGTTRVEFFYRKALKTASDPDDVDENAFRYPGPKPDTKETGILMICEAVEAAVRSIKNPDVMKIEAMIDKIIKGRVDDGQLDECPLTLGELTKIKGEVDGTTGMLPVLRGIYHIRVEYPDDQKEGTLGESNK